MKHKYVLITGGTGGLGITVTRAVLDAGARQITLGYRSQKSIDTLKAQLSQEDLPRLSFIQGNLNDEISVESIVNSMERVDVLIQLVGDFAMGKTEDFSFTDWQNMFDVNLNNTFLLCKHSLKKMRQTGYGRIVTVGSRGILQPAGQLAAYSASKAGVLALMGAIAEETKEKYLDITANCVLPSVIDTPKNREAMGTERVWSWVKPESLAGVICFLASEAARDIRGAAIPVYGKT